MCVRSFDLGFGFRLFGVMLGVFGLRVGRGLGFCWGFCLGFVADAILGVHVHSLFCYNPSILSLC